MKGFRMEVFAGLEDSRMDEEMKEAKKMARNGRSSKFSEGPNVEQEEFK